jgi:hypothetical protein
MADNHFEAAPEGGVKLKDEQPKVQDVKAPETTTEQSENGLAPAEEATPETVTPKADAEIRAEATPVATDDGEPEDDADPKVDADDDE